MRIPLRDVRCDRIFVIRSAPIIHKAVERWPTGEVGVCDRFEGVSRQFEPILAFKEAVHGEWQLCNAVRETPKSSVDAR